MCEFTQFSTNKKKLGEELHAKHKDTMCLIPENHLLVFLTLNLSHNLKLEIGKMNTSREKWAKDMGKLITNINNSCP